MLSARHAPLECPSPKHLARAISVTVLVTCIFLVGAWLVSRMSEDTLKAATSDFAVGVPIYILELALFVCSSASPP
jgi:hypothetical protein